MSSYQEIKDKMYGKTAATSSGQKTSGSNSGGDSTGSSYSDIRNRMFSNTMTIGNGDSERQAVSNWMNRYNRVMQGVSDYDRKRNGGYTKDASGGFKSEIESLLSDYENIKDYAYTNGLKNPTKVLNQLRDLQNSIDEMDNIFAKFDDEEDYNRYLEELYDREEMRKVDLKAYGQEIADLEQELERWMDPDSDIGSMTWMEYDAKIEEMQKDLDERKLYYAQAKRIQDEDASAEKYGKVSKSADFASKSGYDPNNQEIGYQYVNTDASGRMDMEQQYGKYATQFADMGIDSMNDEERAVYNYYMNSGDREEAAAYLRWLEETLQIRKGEETDAALDKIAEDSPRGAKALRYAFMANLGYDQHLSGMKGMGNMIAGKEDYVPATATQVAGERVREDLGQYGLQLPEWMGGGSTGQMVGDLISTTANMAPSMMVGATVGRFIPGAGAAVMGASAGGSAYQEKINEGYSKEQARKYGIAVGASETALSAALSGIKSLGGGLTNFVIEDALQGVKSGLGRFIIEYGGSIASEALEEGIQEILTPIFSNQILGTDEKVDWGQVVYSALLGGLSAGILEGPSTVASARKGAAEARNATAAPNNATAPETETVQMTGDIDSFAKQYGTQAKAVRQNYIDGQDLQEYEVGFQAAFAVGRESGKKEGLKNVPYLSQSQKEIAFNLGREAAAREAKEAAPKQTGIAAKRITDQGTQDVTIAEVTGMDNDTMTFRLEDGSTVTDEGLEIENGQEVLSAVWELGMNTEQANAVVTGMASNKATDVAQAVGLQEAYHYGTSGYTMEQLTQRGKDAAVLTDGQRKAAWEAGRQIWMQKAETPSNKVKPTGKTGVWFDNGGGDVIAYDQFDTTGLKDAAKAGVQAAQVLQKLGIGKNYYFYESYVNEAGNRVYKDENGIEQDAPNGWYDPADGSIHIDLNAGRNANGVTLYTLSHELVHMVEDQNKKAYRRLADFLVENYAKGEDVDALVFKKQAELSANHTEPVTYEEAYSEFIADSMEAMLSDGNVLEKLQEMKKNDRDLFDRIKAFFEKVLKDIRKFYQNLKPDSDEGKTVLQMKDQIEQIQQLFAEALAETGEMQAVEAIGLEVDADTESIAPAVMYSERTWTESDYVQERNKAAQEIAQAIGVTEKKARDYIDSINSIAKMIAEDRTRLDYFSSPYRSSFVSNVEYGGSFDFSTLCKKRRLLTGTFTAIQKALPNTALTANEILDIRNRMKDAGLEVSCGLCYVEGSRANMGQFAKEFLRLYKQYYPDAWQPNMADVNTPDGIEWVRINHPECYEQYEYFWNHYGTLKPGDKNLFTSQQKPKLYQLHTEYKGEILQKFKNDDNVEEKNRNGGIRLQSFSDFEIVHLIDTMQIIMDMSRVGLAGQAYTKVPDFAWALGDTGLKINLSLIAKDVDADGKLIFDDIEGMPIAEAMRLRDRYSANVGTILVAFNDAQLMAAMADDRVDFIIPFHRSQWKKRRYEAIGLPAKTKDYTFMQNEKFIKPQYHEYRGRMVKDKATNYMPNEYWDFSKSGKENAVAYLEMCARNNKRPKFYKLLQNNGDGSYSLKADGSTDGYWKLLIDFKMYDNDGNGSPQMAVRPEFNMEEAARMMREYKGGHSSFPVAQGIVDEFVGEYKEKHGKRMYSDRYTVPAGQNLASQKKFFSWDFMTALPDMEVITLPEVSIVMDKKEGIQQGQVVKLGLENARKTGEEIEGKIYVTNKYTNRKLRIDTESIRHGLNGDFNRLLTNSRMGAVIGDIVRNAVPLNGRVDTASNVLGTYSMGIYTTDSRNREFVGIVTVEERTGSVVSMQYYDVTHAVNGRQRRIKKDSQADTKSQGVNPIKAVTISIEDFLGIVKETHQSLLSESVLDHFGEVRNPKGDFTGTVLHQDRTTGTSNRDLLAGVFDQLVQKPDEKEFLEKYRKNIKGLNEQEAKLQELRRQIREISFGKGPRDTKKLKELQEEATKTANRINTYDKILLNLEATVPLKRVLERERQKVKQKADADKKAAVAKVREETKAAIEGVQSESEIMEREFLRLMRAYEKLSSDSAEKAKKAKKAIDKKQDTIDSYKSDLATMEREFLRVMKGYETAERKTNAFWEGEFKRLMREYEASGRKVDRLEAKLKAQRESIRSNVDSRRRTVLRNKIRKDIRELDKILNKGNKKRNVKQGMQDFVAKAIATGEILFADLDSDTDLIASGIQTDMTTDERKLLTEAERYVRQIAELEGNEAMADVLAARQRGLNEVLKQLQPVLERERIRINSADASSAFDALVAAYESLQESPDTYIAAAFNPDALEYLRSVKHKFAGTLVKDMTQEQLQELHKCYKMVMTMIRDANKAFVDGRSVQADAEQLVQEFQERAIPTKKVGIILRNLSNAVGWNYEKLYYALERINSPTLKRLYQNLADSENITMQDVQEAKTFQMEMVEKYHYNDWKTDQKMERTFLDNNGKEFHLTLGELMALYAYSRREGADRHIEVGGFTFGKNALTDPKPASTYKLTADQVAAISDLLTPEQKSFAEAMQRYLSKAMGAKGNEVSMKLYGIEMFGEENYFPLHIAGEYKARAQESQAKAEAGFQSMTNAGFTKARNTNATAPIVLESFMEVWVDHVNEMARYHGAVPALEDIRRVMNYSVYSDAMENSVSVKAAMTNAYGKQAVQYFDSLYREANSGAVTDKMDAVSKKLLSSFRKNSVAYSGSVVIQQPASIYRAMAIVAPKYFGQHGLFTLTRGVLRVFNRAKWNAAYADMMKYAPGVTMAKEIGGFDTSTGGSIRSYLLDTDRGFRQNMKNGTAAQKAGAVLNVVDDNVIANLPNVADKIAWIEIWEACRRETVANNPKLATGSEAFKQKVGQRFTEVIRATQVYDSMFSKSPMLKSKNLAVQYVVSFMNEPNTVANMAEKALRDVLNKDIKTAGKTVGALATSIVITNLLKSIVYAMRDDDEDETFREKYLSAVAGNLVSDVNLLNYIPYARDIWSLKEGYDVERADMAVVADAVNAITKLQKLNREDVTRMTEEELEEWDKKVMDAQWKVAESLSPLAGIPLKNIRREVLAAINAVKIWELDKTRESTELSIRHAIEEATGQAERSDREKLYEAIVAGDKVYTERLKAGYKDEDAYHTAIRKVLREKDSRIWEAAIAWNAGDLETYMKVARTIIEEGNFIQDDVVLAIRAEANSMVENDSSGSSKAKGYFTSENLGTAMAQKNTTMADAIRKDMIDTKMANGKTREEAQKSVESTARSQLKELYEAGDITASAAETMLVRYGGYDREEAASRVAEWKYETDHPDLDGRITYTQYKRWEADGKSRGVSLENFTAVAEYRGGDTSTGVRSQEDVAAYINSMPISTAQKDALWCCFWSEKTLYKNAPWH